jgi:hypothetical protein
MAPAATLIDVLPLDGAIEGTFQRLIEVRLWMTVSLVRHEIDVIPACRVLDGRQCLFDDEILVVRVHRLL